MRELIIITPLKIADEIIGPRIWRYDVRRMRNLHVWHLLWR